MRRGVDLVVAVPALIVLAPLLLVLGLAVRLESPGPAIFRQTRVGRDVVPFEILKLRTMRDGTNSSVLGGRIDPRVTRLGMILRRTHFDELPQLVNVIRGEMTLIGPRPEVPEFVAFYTPEQRRVLNERPGITGPGQIEYARRWEPLLEGAADPNRVYRDLVMGPKLELDLAYLSDRSLGGDLRIVTHTATALARAVLGRR